MPPPSPSASPIWPSSSSSCYSPSSSSRELYSVIHVFFLVPVFRLALALAPHDVHRHHDAAAQPELIFVSLRLPVVTVLAKILVVVVVVAAAAAARISSPDTSCPRASDLFVFLAPKSRSLQRLGPAGLGPVRARSVRAVRPRGSRRAPSSPAVRAWPAPPPPAACSAPARQQRLPLRATTARR